MGLPQWQVHLAPKPGELEQLMPREQFLPFLGVRYEGLAVRGAERKVCVPIYF